MADDRGHTLRLCDSPLIVRLRGIDEDLFERTCRERISLSVVTKGMLSAPGTRAYHVVVSATDKDHAIKTASELFTQYIARKAGAA